MYYPFGHYCAVFIVFTLLSLFRSVLASPGPRSSVVRPTFLSVTVSVPLCLPSRGERRSVIPLTCFLGLVLNSERLEVPISYLDGVRVALSI